MKLRVSYIYLFSSFSNIVPASTYEPSFSCSLSFHLIVWLKNQVCEFRNPDCLSQKLYLAGFSIPSSAGEMILEIRNQHYCQCWVPWAWHSFCRGLSHFLSDDSSKPAWWSICHLVGFCIVAFYGPRSKRSFTSCPVCWLYYIIFVFWLFPPLGM